MEQKTHLQLSLSRILYEVGMSRNMLAKKCGVTEATIRSVANGQRCTDKVLSSICKNISDDKRHVLEIITSHLKDEIERAGYDVSFVTEELIEQQNHLENLSFLDNAVVEDGVLLIKEACNGNRDVKNIITGIAKLFRKSGVAEKKTGLKKSNLNRISAVRANSFFPYGVTSSNVQTDFFKVQVA